MLLSALQVVRTVLVPHRTVRTLRIKRSILIALLATSTGLYNKKELTNMMVFPWLLATPLYKRILRFSDDKEWTCTIALHLRLA
jgi:hypothetical protein